MSYGEKVYNELCHTLPAGLGEQQSRWGWTLQYVAKPSADFGRATKHAYPIFEETATITILTIQTQYLPSLHPSRLTGNHGTTSLQSNLAVVR